VSPSIRCRLDEHGADGVRARELCDLQEVVEARTIDEVSEAIRRVEIATARGSIAAGFVAYEAAPAFDRALRVAPRAEQPGLPLAWFGLFASERPVPPLEPHDGGAATIAGASPWSCEVGRDDHLAAMARLRKAIVAGDTYLTNLTTRYRRPWSDGDDAFALYRQLAGQYARGLHAYLETDDWIVMSGSPELFFAVRDRTITVQPMKGTAARGRWSDEDRVVAERLRTSDKERAENVMVVDLVRNDLGRVSVPGSITVPRLCEVERHPTLWQLSSTVTGALRPEAGLDDVFAALFPCASVTGAPKVSTMELIAEVEASPRGVYCGAIGYARRADDGSDPSSLEARFSVAIRTAVVDKRAGTATYGSGGGISADSDPDDEWHEVALKAQVLFGLGADRAPQAPLLETMRFDPADRIAGATGVRNLEGHLARLRSSADHLGRPLPDDLHDQVVQSVADVGPSRIRMLVDLDGTVAIEHHPLPDDLVPGHRIHLCLDHEPVDPDDVGLFHKTADRRRYDERSLRHPEADDVVLVNLRGEVTETTRANLAVRIGARWFTPPIDSGLLPGVERQRLVADGSLVERVLDVADLLVADEVATVNSLRGWTPATVQTCATCRAGDGPRRDIAGASTLGSSLR
jgi:para-aminobenzoate synthetase/4-amino-4-deoxychorismate lyase